MKIGLIAFGVLIIGTVAALAISDKLVFGSWRYKITVTISTPEGDVSGSSIRQVYSSVPLVRLLGEAPGASIKGEAVVIDMPDGKKLFAVIGSESYRDVYHAFPLDVGGGTAKGIKYYRGLPAGTKAELPEQYWPGLVMFDDVNNPLSIRLIRGHEFNPETQNSDPVNILPNKFGIGTMVKNVTIEMPREHVTNRILSDLPFLPSVKKGSLDGQIGGGGPALANKLHYGNFKIGK